MAFRYTFSNVKKAVFAVLVVLLAVHSALAEETSFRRVKIPDLSGRQTKAVLTFSDDHKALELRPSKGDAVNISYSQIDKCSYEFTRKHRVSASTIVLAATTGVGAVVMLTKSRSHWLEVAYHDQDAPKILVLRMDKHNYVRILEALKSHTGIDAEILGNADKLHK